MTKSKLPALACATLFGALALSSNAQAHALPSCDDAGVLAKVSRQLLIGEKNVVQSGDPIKQLTRTRQTKLRENGPRSIAQRYCRAKGYTERGRRKTVYYVIEQHTGFASFRYGVEACISGRDPWKIHGAYCRSVR
jgi:hypothetical protein